MFLEVLGNLFLLQNYYQLQLCKFAVGRVIGRHQLLVFQRIKNFQNQL